MNQPKPNRSPASHARNSMHKTSFALAMALASTLFAPAYAAAPSDASTGYKIATTRTPARFCRALSRQDLAGLKKQTQFLSLRATGFMPPRFAEPVLAVHLLDSEGERLQEVLRAPLRPIVSAESDAPQRFWISTPRAFSAARAGRPLCFEVSFSQGGIASDDGRVAVDILLEP
jgi:hypothetical protein